jgi:hypothetical protein
MLGGFGSARWRPVRAEVAQVHSVQYLAAGPAGDLGTLSSDRVFLPLALERRIGTMVNYPLSRSRGAADLCPDPL